MGIGSMALGSLLVSDSSAATRSFDNPLAPRKPHFPGKAKSVIYLHMAGSPPHLDLLDYKPELVRLNGQPCPDEFLKGKRFAFTSGVPKLLGTPRKFAQHGESGTWLSDALPRLAGVVDELAIIRSMNTDQFNHAPAQMLLYTGFPRMGRPSMGAWVTYGLGSENENLPTYVSIPDLRGEPPNGKANWTNGFLPAQHQAIVMADHRAIRNLKRPQGISPEEERATRDFLERLNDTHAATHPGNSELQARMAAYELAARMQLSAPEVAALQDEPATIHTLYGTEDANPLKASYARNCLLARRLLERGVRYVNLYCGSRASGVDGLLNWDAHKTLKKDYERHCAIFDGPTAALLTDLKQRGLLDETLVLWTTEFGRMPTHQEGTTGRDHNPDGFTCWMMGAGVKGGVSFGATDEFGRRAEVNPVTVWDYYATVLHLLGLDHKRLTYYYNCLGRRLTDVHGHVLRDLLS